MFRPVMPQRRRTPSAASTPEPKPEPTPEPRRPRSAGPRPRPPIEMTATGPFAMGVAERSAPRTSARTASRIPQKMQTTMATSERTDDADERNTIDIDQVQELDDAAPQTLMQAPLAVKRENMPIKMEEDMSNNETNAQQALDLSESEDEEGEDELAGRFGTSLQEGSSDGQLFLFQFPTKIPSFSNEVEAEADAPKPDPDAPPLPPVEGQIGQLDIYQDGRVILRLGDVPYLLTGGSDTSFLQQVMLLNPQAQQAQCLGELDAKLVATPDLDYLLDQTDTP